MCGIMGYIGSEPAANILLSGLEKLSYRGYDSAGIALHENNGLQMIKTAGRIDALRKKCHQQSLFGTVGIGHTRWATHGPATDLNAHPHADALRRIAVVHNGVIENHAALRSMLSDRGCSFVSDTDTECVAHLLRLLYDGDMLHTLLRAARHLKGSYALAVLCADAPDAIYCIRCGSPLVLGVGENAGFLASDIPALLPYTRNIAVLKDGEAAVLRRDGILVSGKNGSSRRAETFRASWDAQDASLGAYPHYMLKEIFEQPQILSRNLPANFPPVPDQVLLLGCGTAYHACLLGAYYIETLAKLPAHIEIASEYPCRAHFPQQNSLCIAVSQSGETADTLSAARLARSRGMQLVSLTNTLGSTLQQTSDISLITLAGPELSVASTKAYTAQVMALLQLALHWSNTKLPLENIPRWAQEALSLQDAIRTYIEPRVNKSLFLFIGRGADVITAREAALKFKEITYIPAEACPAGELKHGTLALISKGTPVIALCTQPEYLQKTLISLSECRARGAECACFCLPSMKEEAEKAAEHVFVLSDMPPLLAPIVSIIPLQLLAYHAACALKRDVDKPRNLAKSVTVE